MEANIDVSKSIRKKRLIYEKGPFITDYLITYIGSLLIILLPSIFLIALIKVLPFYSILMMLAFITWMVANLLLLNVLIEIKGSAINNNRTEIIKLINSRFGLDIEDQGQTIIRNVRWSGFVRWGRIITILLDNNVVYINIQTLGRADTLSFFHGLFNYLKGKTIAKRFSNILLQKPES